MKILYHHRTASKDGQAVHIEELIHAFRGLGHTVIVVEPPVSAGQRFGSKPSGPLAWIRSKLPKKLYELLEIGYNVPEFFRLRRAYLDHRPDVLYERHNLYLLAGAWLKWWFKLPYWLEVNSPVFLERDRVHGIALPGIAERSERWVWRQADRLFPVTQVLADIVAQGGVPRERMEVIHNGIDPERFNEALPLQEAKRRHGLSSWLVLGFTGFVREWNGLEAAIDYIAGPGREQCFLLIVGDGPAKDALTARAQSRGVANRMRITGVVPRDAVRDHVAAFDIALQPAATAYASPLKLFEYLVLGRAIIAPSQPNFLEILTDDVNAVLFTANQAQAFEAALDRLVHDQALRLRLGEAAQRLIGQRQYTWRANAERIAGQVADSPVAHDSAIRLSQK